MAIVISAPICHHFRDINSPNVRDLDTDGYNETRSNVNMPIEIPHATFYLMPIAMFALSPFAIDSQSKYAWPWLWPLEWVKIKCKYDNRKATCDVICVGNCNICPICPHLWDIHGRSVPDLDFESEPRSNVRMTAEWPYAAFYSLAIAMFAPSVTVCYKFSVEICLALILTLKGANVKCRYMPLERPHTTFYLLAMAIDINQLAILLSFVALLLGL